MRRDPGLEAERACWDRGLRRVAGVDEAGLGALCAPVIAAAVILHPEAEPIAGVRDSKQLSRVRRDALAERIREEALAVGVGAASVAEIERLNVRRASHLAMRRALARLGGWDHLLVDGSPIAGFEAEVGPYRAIVGGDASSVSIACASILAKVTRDRLMDRLALRYPGYGWERNAGYGTGDHLAALAAIGPSPFHRRGFGPVRELLDGRQLGLDL